MNSTPQEEVIKAGDTYLTEGSDYWTSGIDVGDHGNRIECYGQPESEAIALRDRVIAALTPTQSEPTAEMIEAVARAICAVEEPEPRLVEKFWPDFKGEARAAILATALRSAGEKPCTCHPEDRPAVCPHKYALSDCLASAGGESSGALLSELLAVIHRDGGQYEAAHGTPKAVADAMQLSSERIAALSSPPVTVDNEALEEAFRQGDCAWTVREAVRKLFAALQGQSRTAGEGK